MSDTDSCSLSVSGLAPGALSGTGNRKMRSQGAPNIPGTVLGTLGMLPHFVFTKLPAGGSRDVHVKEEAVQGG